MSGEPFFKQPRSAKVERHRRFLKRKGAEDAEKKRVRGRDRFCRFPLCGCRHAGLRTEVSHSRHKGMGGNPKGDRSSADLMVLVCSARHKENRVAIDRGTLTWEPLTDAGAFGPIAWSMRQDELPKDLQDVPIGADPWIELARETAIGVYESLTPRQRTILKYLATMDL